MKRALVPILTALLAAAGGAAAQTDLANAPLAQSVSDNVKPNLLFILDDSGSMASRYLPDFINDNNIDKPRCRNSDCETTTVGAEGNPPWYAYQFNTLYYNPSVTYRPALNADGTSMASYGSPWTAVRKNPFVNTDTIDLVSGYPELVYCKNADDTATSSNCRRHGQTGTGQTGNPFVYNTATVSDDSLATGLPNGTGSGDYRWPVTRSGNPFYYEIQPVEHCKDEELTDCTLATTPTGSYTYPAPVRYCNSASDAHSSSAVAGTVNLTSPKRTVAKCQDKYTPDHKRPRYGKFLRVDIVSTTASYTRSADRSDCATAGSCTYAEEMTNFANWYAYYSSRIQMMKTSTGRAFASIDDRFRIGFITINPTNSGEVVSGKYLKIDAFAGSHKTGWFDKLYGATTGSTTPLRIALARAGRHYAGKTDLINKGMNDDPIQYSCQRNVALLTSDGYWNEGGGVQVDGSTSIGNQDNADSGASARTLGVYDGDLSATGFTSSNTLADVAQYYFAGDLRPTGSVSTANVPTSTRYTNPEQHMITFTLGLGLDGRMRYRPDYESASSGDFWKIKNDSNTCPWGKNGACNWPQIPTSPDAVSSTSNVDPSKIDDLWHAAVNGRGKYISARDAQSLVDGLRGALDEMKVREGAAAASATSSPNITHSDNLLFSSSYRTAKWDGELKAQQINPVTGAIVPDSTTWTARDQLNARMATADGRTIYTNVGGSRVAFTYANLDAAAKAYFDSRCSLLSQCGSLTAAEQAVANNGAHLVNYLRGQRSHEMLTAGGGSFRLREYLLGDMAGSRPAFVREPRRAYGDAVANSYGDFKAANANRAPVVYIGSNSGMLHAFSADPADGGTGGAELWAFVPRAMLPNLYKLADADYGANHRYFVDGSPTVQDVYFGSAWHTVLVGGYNGGGRGFYALDVTDPSNPVLLWEICADSTLCSNHEANMGYSFGNPVITKRPSDGKWVALLTSGYNNVAPGDGVGYLYVVDIADGTVLSRVSTTVGSTSAPSGFARISAWVRDPRLDNTALYVYGGDLEGNVWRFDMTATPPGVLKLAELRDAAGKVQPVTARPELGLIDGRKVLFVGTGRLLGLSDLQNPATLTPAQSWSYVGSMYALKDSGSTLGAVRGSGTLVAQTVSAIDASRRTTSKNTVDWATKNGWYLDLPSTGERMNLDPQLVLGTLAFVGNIPSNDACTTGGSSWLYYVDFRTGGYVSTSTNHVSGTLQSGSTTVGVVIYQTSDGATKYNQTLADGTQQTGGLPTAAGSGSVRRVGWRELMR